MSGDPTAGVAWAQAWQPITDTEPPEHVSVLFGAEGYMPRQGSMRNRPERFADHAASWEPTHWMPLPPPPRADAGPPPPPPHDVLEGLMMVRLDAPDEDHPAIDAAIALLRRLASVEAAAKAVTLSAWTDRWGRLHGHPSVVALERALAPAPAAEPAPRESDETIRELAERMARLNDVHVDRAEAAVRNLIAHGLIELGGPPRADDNGEGPDGKQTP